MYVMECNGQPFCCVWAIEPKTTKLRGVIPAMASHSLKSKLWGKLRAKNSNTSSLWLAERGDRVVRVGGSILLPSPTETSFWRYAQFWNWRQIKSLKIGLQFLLTSITSGTGKVYYIAQIVHFIILVETWHLGPFWMIFAREISWAGPLMGVASHTFN